MNNKIFLANYCQFIEAQITAQSQQSQHAGMSAGAQVRVAGSHTAFMWMVVVPGQL